MFANAKTIAANAIGSSAPRQPSSSSAQPSPTLATRFSA